MPAAPLPLFVEYTFCFSGLPSFVFKNVFKRHGNNYFLFMHLAGRGKGQFGSGSVGGALYARHG